MKDEKVLKHPKKPTKINSIKFLFAKFEPSKIPKNNEAKTCLLYTSDAADE